MPLMSGVTRKVIKEKVREVNTKTQSGELNMI